MESQKTTLKLGKSLSTEMQSKLSQLAPSANQKEVDILPAQENITTPPAASEKLSDSDPEKATTKKPKWKTKKEFVKGKYKEILAFLRVQHPDCFTTPPKPLKLKIHEDLHRLYSGKFSKTIIGKFFTVYCGTKQYKQTLIAGADRVDLAGNVTGQITEEEIAWLKPQHQQPVENETQNS